MKIKALINKEKMDELEINLHTLVFDSIDKRTIEELREFVKEAYLEESGELKTLTGKITLATEIYGVEIELKGK